MDKVRVGIIGLGGIAQLIHLPVLRKMKNIEITAAAEINRSRLKEVSERFRIPEQFQNHQQMLESAPIDAVIIATPTGTHKDIIIDCIRARKHILVEKPIARTYAETKEIAKELGNKNLVMMVGMNLRYRPDIMLLKSILKSNEIGSLQYVKCGWLKPESSHSRWIRNKELAGGGVVLDLGIVLVDLALWMLDFPEVESVSSRLFYKTTKTVEDSAVSFIRCANNSIISLETSWTMGGDKDSFYFEVYGTKGYGSLNPLKIYSTATNQTLDLPLSSMHSSVHTYHKSYFNEHSLFFSAVRSEREAASSINEALARMQVADCIYQSDIQKREIIIRSES